MEKREKLQVLKKLSREWCQVPIYQYLSKILCSFDTFTPTLKEIHGLRLNA